MTTLAQAEVKKVLSLRYWWALAVAPVVVALAAASFTRPIVEAVAERADTDFDVNLVSTAIAVGGPTTIALVFAALFGATAAGNEFTYATFTTTFLTARGRDAVLAAKLSVVAAFAVGYALVVQVVAVGAMLLFTRDFSFTADLFAICGVGIVACALWALIGAGVTLLAGSQLVGMLSVIGWFVFGEWILRALAFAVGADGIGKALPVSATLGVLVNAAPSIDIDLLSSWPGAAMILAAWVVALVGGGWLRTRMRDIT